MEQYTHCQFVDDTNVIIGAKREYVEATFDIFRCSLFIKEEGVKAILVPDQPMPDEIKELNVRWEEEAGLTKLLGFFIGEDISANSMTKYLTKVKKAWKNPQSLMVRVKTANQLIICILWYMLTHYTP